MRKMLVASLLLMMLGAQGCATNFETFMAGALVGGTLIGAASGCGRGCY